MRPQKLKRVVIKEEFVALTGDHVKALVLGQFLYWMDRRRDFDKFIEEEKGRNPEINMPLSYGWIYKKASELAEELMIGKSETTIRRAIIDLVDSGFVMERSNPNDKWDKTKQYRPDLWAIKSGLEENGYQLEGYVLPNIQNEPSKLTYEDSEQSFESPKLTYEDSEQSFEGTYIEQRLHSEITPENTTEKIKEAFSERRDFLEKPEQREEVSQTPVLTTEISNQSLVNPNSLSGIEYVTEGASAVQNFENAFRSRAKNPKHCFPQAKLLAEAGAAHLWVGPGRTDYAPELKAGVKAKKRGWEQSHSDADVITYINNKLNRHKNGDIGQIDDLLARFEEGKGILYKESPRSAMQANLDTVIPIDRKESRKLSTAQSFLPLELQAKIEQFNAQREAI